MTDLRRLVAAGFLALVLSLSGFRLRSPLSVAAYDDRVPEYAAEILQAVSGGDVQAWLDETLPAQVGMSTPDWYAMALAAHGYDLSAYSAALQQYIAETDIPSGSTRERMALVLAACEPEPPAVCAELLENSAGTMGIMSWVFALHLRNNGVPSAQYSGSLCAETLIAQQAPDGGWSLNGGRGDADITAMTLQALAPYQYEDAVASAVEAGLDFLADAQLSSGAYQSYGIENPESTAQVWTALSALGIDALSDGRFIKNGNTVLDGILQFRLSEGTYTHTLDGDANNMAAMQVYFSLTAAELQQAGNALLLFHGVPQWDASAPAVTELPAGSARPAQTTQRENTPASEDSGSEPTTAETVSAQTETTAASVSESAKTDESAAISISDTAAGTTVTGSENVYTTAPPADSRTDAEKYPYRIPLTAAAGVIFGGAALYFVRRKQHSRKTYLTLAAGFVCVTALIWVLRIESPEQFYQGEAKSGGGTVTMTIRCDAICGLAGSEQYPADGILMPLTEFSVSEGENALELLYDAVKAYGLQIEVDGVSGDVVETAYVRGIASLYEFDFGDLSGWSYEVNGTRPSVGCGAYLLHDGDRIEWVYTIEL